MFGIGLTELLLIAAIALVVLGPEKLPQAARTAGLWYGKIRRTLSNMQNEIEAELNLAEARKQMQEELAKIKEAEKNMHAQMQKMQQNLDDMQANAKQEIDTQSDRFDADVNDSPSKTSSPKSTKNIEPTAPTDTGGDV